MVPSGTFESERVRERDQRERKVKPSSFVIFNSCVTKRVAVTYFFLCDSYFFGGIIQ